MISSFIELLYLLFKNISFYIILLIAVICSFLITNDNITMEGMKMVPTTIGVIFGGLLTTIAIIFSIIKDEELKELYKRHGERFISALYNLKNHMILVLLCLFISILTFFFQMPSFVESLLTSYGMCTMQIFYFLNFFFLSLTMYSTIEVINILFLVFQIKFTINSRKQ